MKSRSLLVQVLSVNLLLVAGTTLVAAIALDHRAASALAGRQMVVLGAGRWSQRCSATGCCCAGGSSRSSG